MKAGSKRAKGVKTSGYVAKEAAARIDTRQLALELAEHLRPKVQLKTFQQIHALIWPARKKRLVVPEAEANIFEQYLLPALGHHTAETLKRHHVESLIAEWESKRGPETLNKIRNTGRRLVRAAQFDGLWNMPNPFEAVELQKVPERDGNILTVEEAAKMLAAIPRVWRPMFRTEVHLGPRKGELFALRVTDYNQARRLIRFTKSHGRDTTKTGRKREKIPVPDALVPWLDKAKAHAEEVGSEYLFPAEGGGRLRHDYDLSAILRSALAVAGIVSHYLYKCRRPECRKQLQSQTQEQRWCPEPECGWKLWCVPVPRPLRFQDLRHTCATLLEEAGCSPAVISEVLGHAAKGTTRRVYTHTKQLEAYMRNELNKLQISAETNSTEMHGTPERRKGFEPSTPSLGRRGRKVKPQASTVSPPVKENSPLMSVAELAKYFSCSTRTIYKLAEENALPAVRIGACVRFDPNAIAAFIRGGGMK